jgi:hypothetical protein
MARKLPARVAGKSDAASPAMTGEQASSKAANVSNRIL